MHVDIFNFCIDSCELPCKEVVGTNFDGFGRSGKDYDLFGRILTQGFGCFCVMVGVSKSVVTHLDGF